MSKNGYIVSFSNKNTNLPIEDEIKINASSLIEVKSLLQGVFDDFNSIEKELEVDIYLIKKTPWKIESCHSKYITNKEFMKNLNSLRKKIENPKLISLDVDELFIDLHKQVNNLLLKTRNKQYSITEVTGWEFLTRRYPEIIDLYRSENLYDNAELIKGMKELLINIIKTYGSENIQFITSTFERTQKSKQEAMFRLLGDVEGFHNIPIYYVGLQNESEKSHHKYEYSKGTVLIDDADHNCFEHLKNNPNDKAILFSKGYGYNNKLKELKEYKDNGRLVVAYSPKHLEFIMEHYKKNKNFPSFESYKKTVKEKILSNKIDNFSEEDIENYLNKEKIENETHIPNIVEFNPQMIEKIENIDFFTKTKTIKKTLN